MNKQRLALRVAALGAVGAMASGIGVASASAAVHTDGSGNASVTTTVTGPAAVIVDAGVVTDAPGPWAPPCPPPPCVPCSPWWYTYHHGLVDHVLWDLL